jgi:hypothetical protein
VAGPYPASDTSSLTNVETRRNKNLSLNVYFMRTTRMPALAGNSPEFSDTRSSHPTGMVLAVLLISLRWGVQV